MEPIAVPDEAKAARSDCRLVAMGPPQGVSDEDCGTAEMLIGGRPLPGFAGRAQYAYFRPTAEELEQLERGGFLEMCQIGTVVQPFSLAVWPVEERKTLCRHCGGAIRVASSTWSVVTWAHVDEEAAGPRHGASPAAS